MAPEEKPPAAKKKGKAEEEAEPVVEEPQICYIELLSDELQSRILGRLPWITRIQCRAVCRRWNALATAQAVDPQQPCLLLACNYCDPHWKMGTAMFIFDPRNSSWSRFKVPDAIESTTVRLCRSAAGTSGLVVFRGKVDKGKEWEPMYWVGNPMTNKWREIPCPKEDKGHNECIVSEEIIWNDEKQLYELLVFKVRLMFSGLCRWVTYRYNWRSLKWIQGNWKKEAVEFKEVHGSCVERSMVYFLQEASPHPKKSTVKRLQIMGYDVEEDEYRVIYPPAEFVCPKGAEFTSAKFELFVSKQLGKLKHPRIEFVATIQMDPLPVPAEPKPEEEDPEADGSNSEASSKSNQKKGDGKKGDAKADAKKGDAKADAKKGDAKADAKKGDAKADAKKGDAKGDAKKGDAKGDAKKGDTKGDAKKGDGKADGKKGDGKADSKKGDGKADGKKDAKGDKKGDGKGKKGKAEEEVVEEEEEEVPEPPPGPRRFCIMRYNPDEKIWTADDKTQMKMEDCFSRECNFMFMATGGPRMCYVGCRNLLNELVMFDAEGSQWSHLPKPFDPLQEPLELKKWYHSAMTPFFPRFDVVPGDFTYGVTLLLLHIFQLIRGENAVSNFSRTR